MGACHISSWFEAVLGTKLQPTRQPRRSCQALARASLQTKAIASAPVRVVADASQVCARNLESLVSCAGHARAKPRLPMSSSRRRFGLLLALAGVAAVVFFVALAPGPRLRAQHELTTWLQGHWVATTLEIKRIGSVRLFLNPTDRMMTPVLLHVRSWEPNETYWVMRSLRPGQTFVDIGANVGYYTVIASRLVGASGRVFAFEPDPVSFALLERNVALNGLDNVVLEQKAVSNEPGTLRLFISPANKGDHRIYQPKGEEREFVEIEAVVLDEYFAGDRRGVDFVKIDTQGAEVVILEGMLGRPDLGGPPGEERKALYQGNPNHRVRRARVPGRRDDRERNLGGLPGSEGRRHSGLPRLCGRPRAAPL